MQHHGSSGFYTDPFGITSQGIDCMPGAFEKQVVDEGRVVHAQPIKFMRQCNDYMKISDGQEHVLLLYNPHFLVDTLTLRTMSISTRVVAYPDMTTMLTSIDMPTELRGSTPAQSTEYFSVIH